MKNLPTRQEYGRRTSGFTLVELLIALGILGIVLAGLLSLTTGTVRFSGLTAAVSDSVEDVAQAEGYLADVFRTAKAVYTNQQLTDGTSTLVDCGASVGRCIAVLTPVIDSSSPRQSIIDFDLSFFSVEPIGTLYANEGVPRGFQGEDTLALLEYRVPNVCAISGTNPCSTVPMTLSAAQRTFSGQPGFLVGGISATDAAGTAVDTFRIVLNDTGAASSLVMQIVTRSDGRGGKDIFTVSSTPVELQVTIRGLAN